jgi:hypothetical protein
VESRSRLAEFPFAKLLDALALKLLRLFLECLAFGRVRGFRGIVTARGDRRAHEKKYERRHERRGATG